MLKSSQDVEGLRKTAAGGLFNGFFSRQHLNPFGKDQLIDGRGRRIFDLMGRACEAGVYPFQLPLETRSGPWVRAEGRDLLMLSSYDYLGLIGDPRIDAAAIDAIQTYGTGTGGVRMLTGTIDLHHAMERELAAFKGMPEAITFSSGYLANLAVVGALLSPQDRVILDCLSHRSLVDACRLAGVQVQRFTHNDPDSLRRELESGRAANRTLVVSDGVFSMDGDICCLPELIELKRQFGCYLMIDESHATGVLGDRGRGTDEHFGIDPSEVDIWSGSLAKAVPSNGGFACVSQELAIYLQHASAPFIFSAALCPSAVAAVRATLDIISAEPERVERVRNNAAFLREALADMGFDTGKSQTAIIPVTLGDEAKTAIFAAALRERAVAVTPVLFPAVPLGSARLRLCVTAGHAQSDLEFALQAFRDLRPMALAG
jgi:glycine C-acetyltransferase